ncbi:hypothetical protein IU459_15095 [Nocardia amamiensis]|uniref:Uncharacterized protein n=1 Tax=Nocardia amamiensis TaxID=404578 RepID=A0ABS0CQM8_9NOCA|nr:hypothetical protein [Nocardia amamiensis]MBF6298860.1 hypothetical protein [Nocardia amamiensis]
MPRKVGTPKKLILAALATAIGVLAAGPANAIPGYADFRPGHQSYRYNGQHGTFTGDVVYASQQPDGGNRLIWSLTLSPYVQRLIVGNTMACGAYVEGKTGYSDNHSAIPADYRWHSVVPNLQLDKQYKLVMNCAFQATNGHVLSPGRADFQMVFTLHSS